MRLTSIPIMLGLAGLLLAAMTVEGAPATAPQAGREQRPASKPAEKPRDKRPPVLTVAILDFSAADAGAPELGSQIGEVLTAVLSGEPGFTLVDRASLQRALLEHELNLSGVVSTEKAVEIGKVVGARILITGRAFTLGKQLFVTAKLIGTETSLVEGVLVKSKTSDDVGELVVGLATEMAERLRKVGPKLVASEEPIDPVPKLKEALAAKQRPTVAVIVAERHVAAPTATPRPRAIDPAVETEIKLLLRECGFAVMDVKENELADWARLLTKNDVDAWPRGLRDVDVVITGEAFSEFAARIGNLVSCSARAEVNLIQRSDGKIVLAERETCRAVDLSEQIAGKNALQKAGRSLGVKVLQHFARTLKAVPEKEGNK